MLHYKMAQAVPRPCREMALLPDGENGHGELGNGVAAVLGADVARALRLRVEWAGNAFVLEPLLLKLLAEHFCTLPAAVRQRFFHGKQIEFDLVLKIQIIFRQLTDEQCDEDRESHLAR